MNVDTKAVAELVCRVLSGMTEPAQEKTVPVGVSNRHIHLTREHLEILFGKGYELTPLKDLSQPGQYACKELLTIVGPDSAPIKRMIQEARDRAMLIDASYGRKTRAVLLMDTDHVILSAIPPETIARRLADPSAEPEREEEEQA